MFNKMGAELNIQFVIFVLLTGFIFSQFLPSFRGKDTNYNLINDLSDDAFSCSSFRDNFFPYLAREKNSKNRMIDSPQAWCPKNEVGPNSKEYIQVDFKDLKALSYLVTNGLDNGNDGFFVSFFYLDYQRENGSEWHRYKNETDHKLIEGNVDSRNMKITKFKSNIIARRIRIIPISNITKTVCLKFTFYGGNFNDGVVEYSMPQGDIFTIYQIKFPLKDRIYDGIEHRKNDNVLRRGIGQLMDNIINENSIASINNGEVNFVGWQNFDKNRKIEMIFRFDKVRIMKGVSFHILNDLKKNISIFSSARFEFSIGGEIYGKCAKNITFKHNADLKLKTARWLHVNLSDSPAKFVRVTLEFRLQWIVLTEVQFTTNVPKEEYPTEKQGSDTRSKSKPNSMFPTSKINNLLICFCVIITFVGLMCIISICILRFRRQRKRRIKGKPLHSIRYGNMPINNVIPIPVVSSSNGGIYKPIPNGVYDCMPGFQSQTLNVRKVTNYPNQQLFGTYSNRKNSNSNQNPGIAPINQDNYNATLSQIVGQPNVALYCPENKRASYDGSYGTSSNPEYSNGSLDKKTLPLHLVPLSPTMYEQYKLNPNNHHGQPNPPHQFNLMSPVLQSYQQDSRQTFVDNFPVNSLAPSMINNYVQPFIYQPANLTIDSSIIRWPNELYELLEKHSRFDTCLQSPVGGSTVLREKFDGNESFTMKDYEEIIMEKLSKIDIKKMELQKLIGSGRYGSIKKGIYNGSVVVVKAINRDCVPSVRISFLKMISDLMKISSKNFVKIVGYCDYSTTDEGEEFPFQDILLKPSISCIIMQHTHQGYLHKFIRRHSRPVSSALINATNNKPGSDTSCTSVEDEPEESSSKPLLSHSCLIYIASQISDGMSFLEHEGLIHRDLATRNCIVGPKLSILITDTAMDNNKFQKDYITINKVLSDLSTIGMDIDVNINFYQPSVSLPLQWMSWEAVLKGRYSSKSDVWSFGVLFWDLLTFCQFRPYFCVPQNLTNIDSTANYVKCLSLLFNFKCLEHGLDNSLMPNNESLSQIRKGTSWTTPLPLPVPSQIINISSDRRLANIQTPRMTHQDSSVNRILDSNREIRDLISSCWSTEPSNRPKFKDISIFLKQKINNFNVEEEYQYIQTNVRRS